VAPLPRTGGAQLPLSTLAGVGLTLAGAGLGILFRRLRR
jgi:LPXTG-motif cell wall-anchored protein